MHILQLMITLTRLVRQRPPMAEMKVAYTNATEASPSYFPMQLLIQKNYHETGAIGFQRNLAQLNAIYELELQDTNSHLKTIETDSMALLHKPWIISPNQLKDTKRLIKLEIADLAKNLGNLNQIYGKHAFGNDI